ncbi:MAG TPA: hypothetical protein VJT50_07395 [Pyrinomonadaceae bacterium]|nr:hypothetical protein [Pyrinomonadaceae bacterium]
MLTRTTLLIGALTLFFAGSICPAQTKRNLKNVTGQYRLRKDEFHNSLDIELLRHDRIKFHLIALWVSHNNPDNIHNGELHGTIELHNNVGVYDGSDCKLKIEFSAAAAKITEINQEGCGFGANVTAAGNYRKVGNRKPRFDF